MVQGVASTIERGARMPPPDGQPVPKQGSALLGQHLALPNSAEQTPASARTHRGHVFEHSYHTRQSACTPVTEIAHTPAGRRRPQMERPGWRSAMLCVGIMFLTVLAVGFMFVVVRAEKQRACMR